MLLSKKKKYKIKGIFDLPEKIGESVLGYDIIGSDDDIKNYQKKENYFLITIGQIGKPWTWAKISSFKLSYNYITKSIFIET